MIFSQEDNLIISLKPMFPKIATQQSSSHSTGGCIHALLCPHLFPKEFSSYSISAFLLSHKSIPSNVI